MALDAEIKRAIVLATQSEGQPDTVAKQLIAWLEEMSDKELSIAEHNQRLALIRDSVELKGEDDLDEN